MKLKSADKIFATTIIILFTVSLTFSVIEFRNRPAAPIPTTPTTMSDQDIYLLGEKYNELEEQLKKLQQSHEMAVLVNQDLDERLSVVEGRNR